MKKKYFIKDAGTFVIISLMILSSITVVADTKNIEKKNYKCIIHKFTRNN